MNQPIQKGQLVALKFTFEEVVGFVTAVSYGKKSVQIALKTTSGARTFHVPYKFLRTVENAGEASS